jgi:hypothetical protein
MGAYLARDILAWRPRPLINRPPLPAAVVSRGIGSLLRVVKDGAGQKLAYVYFEEVPADDRLRS